MGPGLRVPREGTKVGGFPRNGDQGWAPLWMGTKIWGSLGRETRVWIPGVGIWVCGQGYPGIGIRVGGLCGLGQGWCPWGWDQGWGCKPGFGFLGDRDQGWMSLGMGPATPQFYYINVGYKRYISHENVILISDVTKF